MTAFVAKAYQRGVLESVERYFAACHLYPSPSAAFTVVTEELWGEGSPYRAIDGFPTDMPYFCLRVPTGGGKTWLAASSVALVNTQLLHSEHSLILWLVPSKAIRDQTLKALRERQHPYHTALREAGPVTVLDLDEAKSVTRATLDTTTTVIVCTRQAFQVGDTEIRKVYESSGALMHHFEHLDETQRAALLDDDDGVVPCSLANLLRLRRPFVVVDEAHNSRTELSFETLARFRPSGIMELTATPDMERTPSNVLHSVSAAELKGEEMIKLPIQLETEPDWQKCLAYALDRREQLQAAAAAEQRAGAPYLRPVVLIQAQPRRQDHDTLHVDRVRDELVNNHGVRPDEVVIATGDSRGLEAIETEFPGGIADARCPVKYVVTQQALAEGWDCPSAYILVSMAELRSATSVEQLLGRVLRQPQARARESAALNRSYAFVVSRDFSETAKGLRDRLVDGAGFERREAVDFVTAAKVEQVPLDIDGRADRIVITPVAVKLDVAPELKQLPKGLRDKLEWHRKDATLTLRQPLSDEETAAVAAVVAGDDARAAVIEAAATSRKAVRFFRTPAELGVPLRVPQMAVRVQGELQLFDDPEVMDYPFELSVYDAAPTREEKAALGLAEKVSSGGEIDVDAEGRLTVGFMADLQRDLGLAYRPEHWDEVRLATWLCRNLRDPALTHANKRAFVAHWLQALFAETACDLAAANRQKFLIRGLLERRLHALRLAAARQAYQQMLFAPSAAERVVVGDDYWFEFHPQAYAPARDYDHRFGRYQFRHHYYGRIGDFDSREEFECACWLDQQAARGRIDFWVRNLVRREASSFFLQKADGRFYPDFICRLPGGALLVVEYKGADRWEGAKDDRLIGKLWAELSDGRCRFVMVKDRQWAEIDAALGAVPTPDTAPVEHALIRLARALPEQGLHGDEFGTVVHVYAGATAFEVEFPGEPGEAKVVTLERADIRLPGEGGR
jgi:type III restriction enzyme